MNKIICVLTSIYEYRDKVISIFEQRVGLSNIHLWQSKSVEAFAEWIAERVENSGSDTICLVIDNLTMATYLGSIKLNKINKQKVENLPDVDIEFFEYFDEGFNPIMDEDGFLSDNYLNKEAKKAINGFYAVLNNYEGD